MSENAFYVTLAYVVSWVTILGYAWRVQSLLGRSRAALARAANTGSGGKDA